MESDGIIRKAGIMVMTFDDILSYTAYDLYFFLLNHAAFYGKYLRLNKPLTKKEFYGRDKYDIIEWLTDGTPRGITALAAMYGNMQNNYYSKDFMAHSAPTKFADSSLNSIAAIAGKEFTDILILTRYRTDAELKTKKDFIGRAFGKNDKIRIIPVRMQEKYSDVIAAKCPRWDIVVTDSIADVERLAAGDIGHKEFLLPKYGYDSAEYRLKVLILSKDASINYYTAEDM